MSRTDEGGASTDIIEFLKTEARLLHKAAAAGDSGALSRLSKHAPAVALGEEVQRKHCLATVARECGFRSWKAAAECFGGATGNSFEQFLYPKSCHVYWNIWFASHDEAARVREEHGGWLLSFDNQFMVVDEHYIRSLGTDPADPRWDAIGRDWAKPADVGLRMSLALDIARTRLNAVRAGQPMGGFAA